MTEKNRNLLARLAAWWRDQDRKRHEQSNMDLKLNWMGGRRYFDRKIAPQILMRSLRSDGHTTKLICNIDEEYQRWLVR